MSLGVKGLNMVAKLGSTEMDFWRRSARISRKAKIRKIIIEQKMNVTRSLLDAINLLAPELFFLILAHSV